MRIGIDAHMIGERETGNETYVVNLLRALWRQGGNCIPLTPHPQALEVSLGPAGRERAVRVVPGASALRVALGLPAIAWRQDLDLLHMTYLVPPFCPVPVVVTIHDVSFEAYPETFSARDRRLLSWGVPWSARKAVRVIAVSEFTKQDLIRRYGIPAEKIHVTHEAAAEWFQPVEDAARREAVRRRYALEGPYVLCVGNLQPRKNLQRAIEAFALARRTSGFPHRLAVVGKQGWQGEEVPRQVRELGLGEAVVFTGYVPDDELPCLYTDASLFLYAALYEGFGLPPLEAMACGAPVVASKTGALPEVLGDAALLVDPTDVGALAAAIRRVVSDRDLSGRLSEKGRARARQFSWDRTARETLAVYREALAASGSRGRPEARRFA